MGEGMVPGLKIGEFIQAFFDHSRNPSPWQSGWLVNTITEYSAHALLPQLPQIEGEESFTLTGTVICRLHYTKPGKISVAK